MITVKQSISNMFHQGNGHSVSLNISNELMLYSKSYRSVPLVLASLVREYGYNAGTSCLPKFF